MKNKNKGICVLGDDVKKTADFLANEIEKKQIKAVPRDLSNFIKEAKSLNADEEKNYSIERILKLKGLLKSFILQHNIQSTKNLNIFIELMENAQKTYSSATAYYSDAFDKVYTILSKYQYRDFEGSRVYFIDEIARNELYAIQSKLISLTLSSTEKRKLKFNKIVNILNMDYIAISYSVKYKTKYQYISKEESIEKYLPIHYSVVKNKVLKEFRELFATHSFDAVNKRMLEDKRDAQLKRMKEDYDFLMQSLEEGNDIDIKILSYEHAGVYPEIKFTESVGDKTSSKNMHLRSEVVNALWYKPIQMKSSNTVADILKNYNHAFGDVYYLAINTPR